MLPGLGSSASNSQTVRWRSLHRRPLHLAPPHWWKHLGRMQLWWFSSSFLTKTCIIRRSCFIWTRLDILGFLVGRGVDAVCNRTVLSGALFISG